MSRAADSPTRDDSPVSLSPTLAPRPLTGETVTVDAKRHDLTSALAALAHLADDDVTPNGRTSVDAVRQRVETRLDRLATCDRDSLTVRFDAADVVLLALAHFALARHHRSDASPQRAEWFQTGAREWLGRLGSQRPGLVDALARVE